MAKKEPKLEKVLVLSECEHGKTIVRRDETTGETDFYQSVPWHEGDPIPPGSELVKYHGQEGAVAKFEVLHKLGPAMFSTRDYRNNYDRIFGDKKRKSDLN